jgi:uncharacterized protein YjlB
VMLHKLFNFACTSAGTFIKWRTWSELFFKSLFYLHHYHLRLIDLVRERERERERKILLDKHQCKLFFVFSSTGVWT